MYLYHAFNFHNNKPENPRRGKKRLFIILIVFFIFYPPIISEHDSYSLSTPQPALFKQYPLLSAGTEPSSLPATESQSEFGPKTFRGCVNSGDSLYSILLEHGLSSPVISECLEAFKPIFNCRKVAPGYEYTISNDAHGCVTAFTIKASPADIYHIKREGAKLVASKEEVTVDKKICTISGEIDDSLFNAITGTGEQEELAIAFADVFAWDIDFRHALQKGDRCKIIFEKFYVDGEFVRYGRILAAEYINQDKMHRAIFFRDPKGLGTYYTPEGNSLRRRFLRSPLRLTRVSSRYSFRRFHPILKEFRPHLGVDFSAPSGTPVWSVGDGTVTWTGRKNGNGNTVTIRHLFGYETMYNHLSRYGRGIKIGQRVRQKDIIGYVGTTGLSTGPHLDYRMSKNGTFINPLKSSFPQGFPVESAYRPAFAAVVQQMVSSLDKEFSSPLTTLARFQLLQ